MQISQRRMALAGAGSEDEPHGHQQVNHEEQFRGFPPPPNTPHTSMSVTESNPTALAMTTALRADEGSTLRVSQFRTAIPTHGPPKIRRYASA